MSFDESLEACGLNESERVVLTYLLRYGSRRAASIAKGTGVKRPTVYSVVENLCQLGLVTKAEGSGTSTYAAIALDQIPRLFERRAELRYSTSKNAIERLSEDLSQFRKSNLQSMVDYSVTSYNSSDAAFLQLFDAATAGDFCAVFNPQIAVNEYTTHSVSRYLALTSQKKPHIREIAVAGPMTDWYLQRVNNPNHQLKMVEPDRCILSNMIFNGGGVILAHYNETGISTIKIEHPDFFHSMMTIFEMLWSSLP